jgi:hypothetical protein
MQTKGVDQHQKSHAADPEISWFHSYMGNTVRPEGQKKKKFQPNGREATWEGSQRVPLFC